MTHQFRTAFIPFALFLPDLFLDGREFILDRSKPSLVRNLLLCLQLEQFLLFRQKLGKLFIGIRHFFSLNVFWIRPPESRSTSPDCLDLPVR